MENHCSRVGANSTPNHLLLLGGQTPTLRNQRAPVWDMPSLPGHAQGHDEHRFLESVVRQAPPAHGPYPVAW
jgi:hypothetical protein